MYVCRYVRTYYQWIYVCVCTYVGGYRYVCMHACSLRNTSNACYACNVVLCCVLHVVYACMHACSVCLYVCMHACNLCMHVTYVCMHACVHACMHVCMYVCMYVSDVCNVCLAYNAWNACRYVCMTVSNTLMYLSIVCNVCNVCNECNTYLQMCVYMHIYPVCIYVYTGVDLFFYLQAYV